MIERERTCTFLLRWHQDEARDRVEQTREREWGVCVLGVVRGGVERHQSQNACPKAQEQTTLISDAGLMAGRVVDVLR